MMEHLLRFSKTIKIVFLDWETENLCLFIDKNLPWQLGMLKVVGETIEAQYMSYIKWGRPPHVSPGAAQITGFKPEMVFQQGKYYLEVLPIIVEWIDWCDYIAGHNFLAFDLYFLTQVYKMLGKSSVGLAEKVIDTHALAKGIKLGIPFDINKQSLLEYQYQIINTKTKGVKTRLEILGREYQIEHDYTTLHDAISDLILNKKVWDKIKFQVEI